MSELLKQFGLLVIDYLIGFFVSMMMDMKHSVRYRAEMQYKKRCGLDKMEPPEYLDYNNKKYKVACSCSDLLILKEVDEIIYTPDLEPVVTSETKNP